MPTPEKSGVHLTGVDSGWPVASTAEPAPRKDGTGVNELDHATLVEDNEVFDESDEEE